MEFELLRSSFIISGPIPNRSEFPLSLGSSLNSLEETLAPETETLEATCSGMRVEGERNISMVSQVNSFTGIILAAHNIQKCKSKRIARKARTG